MTIQRQDIRTFGDDDAYRFIREHQSAYFPCGYFTALEAAGLIAMEALSRGSTQVSIQRADDWWIVWSNHDWLAEAAGSDVFRRHIHLPGILKGVWKEVLLYVFAPDVVTVSQGHRDVLKGAVDPDLEGVVGGLTAAARVVAFRSPA